MARRARNRKFAQRLGGRLAQIHLVDGGRARQIVVCNGQCRAVPVGDQPLEEREQSLDQRQFAAGKVDDGDAGAGIVAARDHFAVQHERRVQLARHGENSHVFHHILDGKGNLRREARDALRQFHAIQRKVAIVLLVAHAFVAVHQRRIARGDDVGGDEAAIFLRRERRGVNGVFLYTPPVAGTVNSDALESA